MEHVAQRAKEKFAQNFDLELSMEVTWVQMGILLK
jgi:hypothetical protein